MKAKQNNRQGASVVELAFVLPIILLFFFSAWEWSRVEMIKQVAETASFEAARLGKIPGMSNDDIEARAQEILDTYMIFDASVVANVTSTRSHVWLGVPLDQNTWITSRIFKGRLVDTSTTITK